MRRITIYSTVSIIFVICLIILFLSSDNCHDCFSLGIMAIKFFACGIIIFIGSVYFTRVYLQMEKIIHNIEAQPLLKTDEAVSGLPFSCEGITEPVNGYVLKSPYTGTECLYYHSIKEENKQNGKRSEWVIVENFVNCTPFYITDERGKLKVDLTNMDNDFSGFTMGKDIKNDVIPDPKLSEIDCSCIMKYENFDEEDDRYGFIPVIKTLRRSEYILLPKTRVFAYGYVTKQTDGMVLREHPDYPLLISQKTKDRYIEEFYKGHNLVFLVHFLAALGFTLIILSVNYFLHLSPDILILILLIGNFCIGGSIVFTMYNRLIILKERAECALSTIDVELKRRSDLIPQVTELVKKYSAYEKDINLIIASLRSRISYQKLYPDSDRTDFSSFLAIFENYPDLKASDNFRKLMNTLVDTEDRITYSRTFYNRNVRKLNTLITQFPFIILSKLFNIPPMEFITITSTG